MNIGNQYQQAGHLLAALEDAELAAGFDRGSVIRRPTGDTDDFRLGGLRLQHEGRQVRRCEWRTYRTEDLGAVLCDDSGCIALERMAKGVIVGDKEPAVAAALDDLLCRSDRKRTGIKHPLHRVGRAEFTMEVGGAR